MTAKTNSEENLKKLMTILEDTSFIVNNLKINSLIKMYLILERKAPFSLSKYVNLKHKIYIIRDMFLSLPRLLFHKKTYLIFSDTCEFFDVDGKKEDKRFKELMNILDQNYLYLVRDTHFGQLAVKEWSSELTLRILRNLIAPLNRIQCTTNIDILEKEIKRQGYTLSLKRVIKKFFSFCTVLKIYFKLKRPKAVFLRVYCAPDRMAISYVCKSLKIPVIEFQHGMMNKNSVYDGLHATDFSFDKHFLPDYLFYYVLPKDIINDFYLSHEKCINTGEYILEYMVNHKDSFSKKYTNYLLVSLQETCQDKMVTFIIEAAERMPEFNFVLLPRTYEKRPSNLSLPLNVFLEFKRNFYELLLDCKIHVTCYSTCALEAHAVRKPNILIDLLDSLGVNKVLQHDLDMKIVSCVRTVDEFAEKVYHYKTFDEDRKTKDTAPFIMFNHSERLKRALIDIGVIK